MNPLFQIIQLVLELIHYLVFFDYKNLPRLYTRKADSYKLTADTVINQHILKNALHRHLIQTTILMFYSGFHVIFILPVQAAHVLLLPLKIDKADIPDPH